MSQENKNQPRNEGGQRRQGNRNRNRNNQGGNRNNQNRQGSKGGQGRQSGGGPQNPQRRRNRKPMPLTTWEKVLKFFGLYKEPTRPPRRTADNTTTSQEKPAASKTAKSNTRNARGKKGGQDGAKRNFPVETPRLYLGNLSYDADEASLEELFKGVGSVRSVEIVYNRHTHRSKGFGFIEMQNVEEAKRAVEVLHDKPFMGRNLVVNGANNKPKNDNPPRDLKPQENKSRTSKPAPERREKRNNPAKLRIANISFDADESAIEDHFKGIGNVRRVELVYNKQTHASKGFGFVEMQKSEDAQRAIEVLHDQPFMGRKLIVAEAKGGKPNEASDAGSVTEEQAPAKTEAPKKVETTATEAPEPKEETPTKVTEPPVEATEPPVEAIEAPVEATEPPVEATEPPVEAVETPPEVTESAEVTPETPTPAESSDAVEAPETSEAKPDKAASE